MINEQLEIKEKFVEMCKMIFVSSTGKLVFPFENLEYDSDWNQFTNHKDYSILESKMKNLIKITNEDNTILNLDIETEIWDMI
jgi:hypothetical protein